MFLRFEELIQELDKLQAQLDEIKEMVKYIYEGIYGKNDD